MKYNKPVKHLVMFSGGVCSWACAKRVVEKHGTDGVLLLFADTLIEDHDLYRFLPEAVENIGVDFLRIADGRTPWQVFEDERFIGNSGNDPCSKILKRELLNKWRKDHCDPELTITHFGLDWTEDHRLVKIRKRHEPWRIEAYMTEEPIIDKDGMLAWLKREGVKPPHLYSLGFAHNNCGGFCVKSGQAQFELLLRVYPERYARHEAYEHRLRKKLGNFSVMKDRRGGVTKPLTMRAFRKRLQRQPDLFDCHEWGGCGCAVE